MRSETLNRKGRKVHPFGQKKRKCKQCEIWNTLGRKLINKLLLTKLISGESVSPYLCRWLHKIYLCFTVFNDVSFIQHTIIP